MRIIQAVDGVLGSRNESGRARDGNTRSRGHSGAALILAPAPCACPSASRENSLLRSASAPIEPLSTASILLALLVSVLWGGNLISIRIGVDSVPPLWSAFWRMALGVVIVTGWALHRGVAIRPARRGASVGRCLC